MMDARHIPPKTSGDLDTHNKARIKPALDHPLTAVVVGVILTWFFGTAVTWQFQARQEKSRRDAEERLAQSKENSQLANEFSRSVAERRIWADLLVSSLRRNAPLDEIRSRKTSYDAAYVNWNREIEINRIPIGRISDTLEIRFVEILVPLYAASDDYLTRAYDVAIRGDSATQALRDAEKYSPVLLGCSSPIIRQLQFLTTRNVNEPMSASDSTVYNQLERGFRKHCIDKLVRRNGRYVPREPATRR